MRHVGHSIGRAQMGTHYHVVCRDARGRLKWIADLHNLVVTAGLNHLLDATFKTGVAAPAWYLGLKSTGTPDADDTMAAHATWTELTAYAEATRPAFTPGTIAAGSVNNAAAPAVFTANGSMSAAGLFLATANTKGGATGTLYGAADFAEGTRALVSGDTLSVTGTLSATAA